MLLLEKNLHWYINLIWEVIMKLFRFMCNVMYVYVVYCMSVCDHLGSCTVLCAFACGWALIYACFCVRVWSSKAPCGCGYKWITSIIQKLENIFTAFRLLVTSAENKYSLMTFFEFLLHWAVFPYFTYLNGVTQAVWNSWLGDQRRLIYQDVLSVRCV